jgi:hypothetical protein
MAEMQNENPTILNAADLPTRLQPTATPKGEYGGIFTSLPLPVDFLESAPTSDSEDDNLLEEPIDEQEIYGKHGLDSEHETGDRCMRSALTG